MDRTCLFIACIVVVILVISEWTVSATPVNGVHKSKRSLDEDLQLLLRESRRRGQSQRHGNLDLHDLGSNRISSSRRYNARNMRRPSSRRRCTRFMRRMGLCRRRFRG